MNPKALQERKAELGTIIRTMAETINKDNRDFSAEELVRWNEVNKDYNTAERQLEVSLRVETLDADIDAGDIDDPKRSPGRGDIVRRDIEGGPPRTATRGPTFAERDDAVEGWFRHELGLDVHPDAEIRQRQAAGMKACGVRAGSKSFDVPLLSTRELAVFHRADGQASKAGVGLELIPEGFVSSVEVSLQAVGALRQVAGIIRTSTGNALPWPTVDDTAVNGRLLAEETAVTQMNITVGSVTFNAYKYTSDLILVSPELLQDEAVNLPTLIGRLLGERLGRIMNIHFTTGTGSAQPNGFVTQAIVDNLFETGAAGVMDADDIIDLLHKVDPAYRGKASFMMHDNIVGEVRKLVVTDQGYIWQPSFQLGDPDRLLGHPMRINQNMDSDAAIIAGEEIIGFGDFSKYMIREVAGIRIRRLDERYADTDQVGFIAFMRADGDIPDRSGPIAIMRVKA